MDEELSKGKFGLPEGIDPDHEYVYRSGEHGIYDFWYKDRSENYWKYTNAPSDHADYDPYGGESMLVADQPMPHTAPQFYSDEGRKLHLAIPQGMEVVVNEAYDPLNPKSVWYAIYQSEEGESRYVYYDSDIRENLDLWIQYMLRITDAGIVKYRKYASKLFESPHPKDRVIGIMLMLADQGVFEAWELVQARVSDVEYTDMAINLLGRKIICDPALVDFFASATSQRGPDEPLFAMDTVHGQNKVGLRHFYSIFKSLKVSPHFLMYWHATNLYSRIVHRLSLEQVPIEELEERALGELGRALNLGEDPVFLVDYKLKETLYRNYVTQESIDDETPDSSQEQEPEVPEDEEEVVKSLIRVRSDDLGVATVWSDLVSRRPDEQEFSEWLHAAPLHDTTPEEQQELEVQLDSQGQDVEQAENPKQQGGPVNEDAESSPAPGE